MKLTFKQYLESKEQLRKAVDNVPISSNIYEVRHYCSLPLGEYEEDKIVVSLKPKYKIVVEWKYDIIDQPTPLNIKVQGGPLNENNEDETYQTFWSSAKFKKWLTRHTRGL